MEKTFSDGTVFTEDEERQFIEFKRLKLMEEARAKVARLECDLSSPYCDKTEYRQTCRAADRLEIGAVAVRPNMVKSCASFLGKDPKCSLVTLISYPDGGDVTKIKISAVKRAIRDGADEVEVCAPTFFLRDGRSAYFKRECKKLKRVCRGRALRIAFDCGALTEQELIRACSLAADAGANMVRLSGACGELVSCVRSAIKDKCLIKADGASTLTEFERLTALGANSVSSDCATDIASLILNKITQS